MRLPWLEFPQFGIAGKREVIHRRKNCEKMAKKRKKVKNYLLSIIWEEASGGWLLNLDAILSVGYRVILLSDKTL